MNAGASEVVVFTLYIRTAQIVYKIILNICKIVYETRTYVHKTSYARSHQNPRVHKDFRLDKFMCARDTKRHTITILPFIVRGGGDAKLRAQRTALASG